MLVFEVKWIPRKPKNIEIRRSIGNITTGMLLCTPLEVPSHILEKKRQFSVGCQAKSDLRYVYEGHEQFMPLPTYVVAPGLNSTGLYGWPGTIELQF